MSHSGDHPDEMPRNAALDERGVEAILAGDAGATHPELSAFVAEMRALSAGPVPAPSPALSNLFLHGFSTEKGDLPATAASNVTGPAPQAAGLPKWRKKTMAVKQFVAGLSIAGKLTMGVGVAAAATTGAGTAGVLPDPVQHEFARAVDSFVPFEVKDPEPVSELGPPQQPGDGAPSAAREESPSTTAAAPTTTVVVTTTAPPAPRATEPAPQQRAVPAPAPAEAPERPAPTTTAAPAPPTTIVRGETVPTTISLRCVQNAGWTGVVCRWTDERPELADHYVLVIVDPLGRRAERMWGEGVSSFVDVHADTPGSTYRYVLEGRTSKDDVVSRSDEAAVLLVQP